MLSMLRRAPRTRHGRAVAFSRTNRSHGPRRVRKVQVKPTRCSRGRTSIGTKCEQRFVGKTNAEAAQAGLSPQLSDGSFATLHHVGQKAPGPLVEGSTRYHGV